MSQEAPVKMSEESEMFYHRIVETASIHAGRNLLRLAALYRISGASAEL